MKTTIQSWSSFSPLSDTELTETEGGFLPFIIAGIVLLVASCTQSNQQVGNHNSQSNSMNVNYSPNDTTLSSHK